MLAADTGGVHRINPGSLSRPGVLPAIDPASALEFNGPMKEEYIKRLSQIRERMARACSRSGRAPEEVRLIAVSKTVPEDRVRLGIEAGVTDLGENYVQEAQAKVEAIGHGVNWHFIGHLQTNKARFVVRLFDLIHSVDSLKLARELSKRAAGVDRRLPVLVQVNISGETTKGGAAVDEARALIDQVAGLPNLELKGLMTMPPFFDDPDRARPFFSALRELKEAYGPPLQELSMGMSGDFEAAIEEGSTMVRIGTAIFGPRG